MHEEDERLERIQILNKLLIKSQKKYQEYLNDENIGDETLNDEYQSIENLKKKIDSLKNKSKKDVILHDDQPTPKNLINAEVTTCTGN